MQGSRKSADINGIHMALMLNTYILRVLGDVSKTALSGNRDQVLFELFGSDVCNSECRVL